MITIPGVEPIYMWAGFLALVIVLLWIDLAAFNRKDHIIEVKEALLLVGFWVFLALLFNLYLYWQFGSDVGLEFLTGYLIEESLSIDNMFVFLMIFTAFSVPRIYQHRVLFWGILGAIIMRGLFIGVGSALVQRFDWIFLVFGAIILYGAYQMQFDEEKEFDPKKNIVVRFAEKFLPVSKDMDTHDFVVKKNGKHYVTILFIALLSIEVTDVIFATDSIPAIFAITTDPFIIFTSNIFAILGLRSLYFAVAGLHAMFVYLRTGLAAILAFIGIKMLLYKFIHIPTLVSLGVIVAILAIAILASIYKTRGAPRRRAPEEAVESADGHVHVHRYHRKHRAPHE